MSPVLLWVSGALSWIGCVAGPPGGDPDPTLTLSTPEITSISWVCDPDRERWTLDVSASSWTGGGTLWVTVDGRYVEGHGVRSVNAAADGSEDTLRLRLGIVADWRSAVPGSTTTFRCVQPNTQLFELYDLEGEPVDCRIWGDDPQLLDVPDLPECDIPVQEP